MTIDNIKQKLEELKPHLQEKYGIKTIGIFGSRVRGEDQSGSDIDVLVEFPGSSSMFEFVRLELELSDLLGEKVDLVMKSSLKPRIGKHILEEVVYI